MVGSDVTLVRAPAPADADQASTGCGALRWPPRLKIAEIEIITLGVVVIPAQESKTYQCDVFSFRDPES